VHEADHDDGQQRVEVIEVGVQLVDYPQRTRDRCSTIGQRYTPECQCSGGSGGSASQVSVQCGHVPMGRERLRRSCMIRESISAPRRRSRKRGMFR
jgi:hypothetical protein